MKYTKLQENHCMNDRGTSSFCSVNSNKPCVSTKLANLIYDKAKKNQVLRIETIKQELHKPQKKEQQIELHEEKTLIQHC